MNQNETAAIRAQIAAVDTIARAQTAQALALLDVVAALNGPGGWGYYGLDLPWGAHPDVDAHLVLNGHRRPG